MGERNYGCRFLEVQLYGLKTVILENEKIRTTILIDKGTDIIEFNYKQTDTDFVWRNPMGLSCLYKMQKIHQDHDNMNENYLGGWFDIFPHIGGAAQYHGVMMDGHSEAAYLPWDYQVEVDTPQQVTLKCFTKLSKTPFRLEKTITIKSGKAELEIEEKATNIGDVEFGYQWGFHPNVGAPFLDENCVVTLPDCDMEAMGESVRFDAGAIGKNGKIVGKDGAAVDVCKFPKAGSMINELIDVTNMSKNTASIKNTKTGLSLVYEWDKEMFTSAIMWISANNKNGHHHHDGAYVFCLLLKNTETLGLTPAEEKGVLDKIAPMQSKSTWYKISVEKE